MPSIDVYNVEGKKVKSVDLNEEVFGIEIQHHSLYFYAVKKKD